MTVRVRDARPDDRPDLERIQRATLADPNPELLTLGVSGPLATLVAVDETDQPVGYLLPLLGDDAAYISELAVTPSRQGEGIGSKLLETAVTRLADDGVERVRLTAQATDERAQSFYETHGFEAVGRTEDYYADGTAGITYERRLD